MEEEIRKADRDGAPEDELQDLMVRASEIARRVMDARKNKTQTIEERIERAFATHQSGDDQARIKNMAEFNATRGSMEESKDELTRDKERASRSAS